MSVVLLTLSTVAIDLLMDDKVQASGAQLISSLFSDGGGKPTKQASIEFATNLLGALSNNAAVGAVAKTGAGLASGLLSNFSTPEPEKIQQQLATVKLNPALAAKYSNILGRMITMALEDGNITDDEFETLAKQAEEEGINPIEFKLVIQRLRIALKKQEFKQKMRMMRR